MDQQQRRGGARRGAGRKKSVRQHDPPHRVRREHASAQPVHVVMRTQDCVPRLREGRVFQATHQVLGRYVGWDEFRIVHASIQANHFHILVEALDRRALSTGMQSLMINLARRINGALGSYGKIFAHRYHETPITTPRQARNALAYVLNNWRKHHEDLASPRARAAKLDPYASGLTFDGWREHGVRDLPQFTSPPGYDPLPVSRPMTSLLCSEWRIFGAIDPFEVPGALP